MIKKIGILRETREPPDRRVPFSPLQLKSVMEAFPALEVVVQPGDLRCFSNREYSDAGIRLQEDLNDCDVLMGVKEVDKDRLIPGKTYLFFSHTAKKQAYNRGLLQEIIKKKIRLIDYEYLTGHNNIRLAAFGRWAGVVGAYNGIRAWGERYRQFILKPAHLCRDISEVREELKNIGLSPVRILVTGGGRVAMGAVEILSQLSIEQVRPEQFLHHNHEHAVYCRIDPWHYVKRTDGKEFDLGHFFSNPALYESSFKPYTKVTDLFIACHYWDPRSPVFMLPTDMREPGFRIRVIADVSCDIKGPIPSTIRASSIADPFYGYDPLSETETPAFDLQSITVMAVDNLPGELPRDSSVDFGEMLAEKLMPALIAGDTEGIVKRATIAVEGRLTEEFAYLQDYLEDRGQAEKQS